MKRRHFIETVALGTGALSLNPLLSRNFLLNENNNKKLGIALVGLGNYSNNMIGPALLETQYCKLTGIVTGTPDKIPVWTQKYNIPKQSVYNYQNFDEIKNNPDIDIVYIVLPNSMHAEFTIRAAKAGKHVICEKWR